MLVKSNNNAKPTNVVYLLPELMTYFQHRKIETIGNWIVGTIWVFRGCQVEMHDEGFTCNCKKKPRDACNHIKSVQFGILGVGQEYYK